MFGREKAPTARHLYLRNLGLLGVILLLLLTISTTFRLIMRETEALPPVIKHEMQKPQAAKYDFSENLQQRQHELQLQPEPIVPVVEAEKPAVEALPDAPYRLQVLAYKEEEMATLHAARFQEKYQQKTIVTARKEVFWVDFVFADEKSALALQEKLEADGVKSWLAKE